MHVNHHDNAIAPLRIIRSAFGARRAYPRRLFFGVSRNGTILDDSLNVKCVYEKLQHTHVIQMWRDITSRSIICGFNHARVGGGDFLDWAVHISGGYSNSLKDEKGWLGGLIALVRTILYIPFSPFVGKYAQPRGTVLTVEGASVLRTMKTMSRGPGVSTKYMLIHSILEDIVRGYPEEVEHFTCWLPIGFKKGKRSPFNNVGILPFVYKRGESAAQVAASIEAVSFIAEGTNFWLRVASGFAAFKSAMMIKKRVDVVLTLCKVDSVKYPLKQIWSGFLRQNRLFHYPVYVFGITLDSTCHLTYNIVDPRCNAAAIVAGERGNIHEIKDPFLTNI